MRVNSRSVRLGRMARSFFGHDVVEDKVAVEDPILFIYLIFEKQK